MSELVNQLIKQIEKEQLTIPSREFKFSPTRKWRFDLAWVNEKLAVEVEGGIWIGGRHTSGSGFENDCIKYNEAVLQGWRVLRATSNTIKNGSFIATLKYILSTNNMMEIINDN